MCRGTRGVQIMDCPGLFDTGKTNEQVAGKVLAALTSMAGPGGAGGPDVICYVIAVGGYTDEEFAVYERLKAMLGAGCTRYLLPVFTHADRLQGRPVTELAAPRGLTQLLQDCGHRLAVLDNASSARDQHVRKIVEAARAMKAANGGRPFRCPVSSPAQLAACWAQVERGEAERTRFAQQLSARVDQAERAVESQRQRLAAQTQQSASADQQRASSLQVQVTSATTRLNQQQQAATAASAQLRALQQRQAAQQQRQQQERQQQQAQHAAALQQKNAQIAALK